MSNIIGNIESQDAQIDLTLELTKLAQDLSEVDGKFRIAKNESDDSRNTEMEAATFLKYDEKRYGRDFELYNFMKTVAGVQDTVITLVEEILVPIKTLSPIGFTVAQTRIKTWKVFGDKQAEWEEILSSL